MNHLPSTNQPFVPPEKPLEKNIPESSFPDPSLSSTAIETSVESNDVRRNEIQDEVSVTLPTTSQSTPPKVVVKNEEAEKPEKENVLRHHGLASEGMGVSVKTPELEVEPAKSAGMTVSMETKSGGISEHGLQASVAAESEDANTKDIEDEVRVPPVLQEADQLKEDELSDEDESLDLSDLSLPDGNEPYVPSALQTEQRRGSKPEEENVVRKDPEVSAGPSKPAVVPADATKSITEHISEDIHDSAALEDSEGHNDLPVYGEEDKTLPKNTENVSKQPELLDVRSDVDKTKKDTNDSLFKDDKEKAVNELLPKDEEVTAQEKAEEERKPLVSVDGFLALLQAVDADVEVSFSPEALYHSPQCSSDMREEIVR